MGDGLLRLKQVGEYDDIDSLLAEPIEEGQLTVASGEFYQSYDIETSLIATVRPGYDHLRADAPILSEIPLSPRLLFEFDFIGFGNFTIDRQFELPPKFTPVGADVSKVTETRLKQHIALTKESSPEPSADASALIEEIHQETERQIDEYHDPLPPPKRIRDSIRKLARASARIRNAETIETHDVEIAAIGIPDFVTKDSATEIIETVNRDEKDQDVDLTEDLEMSDREIVKNMKELIQSIEDKHEKGAPVERVIDQAKHIGFTKEKTNYEIEKLKQKGELYEPQQGYLRTT